MWPEVSASDMLQSIFQFFRCCSTSILFWSLGCCIESRSIHSLLSAFQRLTDLVSKKLQETCLGLKCFTISNGSCFAKRRGLDQTRTEALPLQGLTWLFLVSRTHPIACEDRARLQAHRGHKLLGLKSTNYPGSRP